MAEPNQRRNIGLSHRTLRQAVAEEIRGMILSGRLQPGERLVEDKLAETLGVSRNPVREAIRSLEATGLVEVEPRRGAYVCRVDVDDVRQLLELRGLIEGYAAELAAARHRPEHIAALDDCIARGDAASVSNDNVEAAESHRDFHLTIEEAAGNRYLEEVVAPLRHRTEMVFSLLVETRGHLAWDEHRAIRDAIAAGDGALARERVVDHLSRVISDVSER